MKVVTVLATVGLGCLCVVPKVAQGQDLLWQNSGQELFGGSALDVSSEGDVVVVSGVVYDADANSAWFVRGIDRKTGWTLWEDQLELVFFDQANAVRVDAGRAFVAGWVFQLGVGFRFVVRAYELLTGAVLWEQSIARGAGRDVAKALTVANGRVYVAGHLRSSTTLSDFALLAFDTESGTLLWESVVNPSGVRQDDFAWSVVATGDRVFVAGEVRNVSSVLVRGLDARNGSVLWEDEVAGFRTFAEERSLAVAGATLILVGALASETRLDYAVIGYDVATGSRRWTHVPPTDGLSGADAVAASGSRVFVVGLVGCDPNTGGSCELGVRAYEAANGALDWEDIVAMPDGDWNFGSNVVAHGNGVFIGTESIDATGNWEGRIRAYRANTGELEWHDVFDGGTATSDHVSSVHVAGNRLYVTGGYSRPDGGANFLVRAYNVR